MVARKIGKGDVPLGPVLFEALGLGLLLLDVRLASSFVLVARSLAARVVEIDKDAMLRKEVKRFEYGLSRVKG